MSKWALTLEEKLTKHQVRTMENPSLRNEFQYYLPSLVTSIATGRLEERHQSPSASTWVKHLSRPRPRDQTLGSPHSHSHPAKKQHQDQLPRDNSPTEYALSPHGMLQEQPGFSRQCSCWRGLAWMESWGNYLKTEYRPLSGTTDLACLLQGVTQPRVEEPCCT